MAYDPNMYNPYAAHQYQQSLPLMSQQANGLIWIDGDEGANMYPLPPNSVSPPLMYRNEPMFAIKTTDGGGAYSIRKFRFEEIEMQSASSSDYATKSDLDKIMAEIQGMKETLNGKPIVQSAAAEQKPNSEYPVNNQIAGTVQHGV